MAAGLLLRLTTTTPPLISLVSSCLLRKRGKLVFYFGKQRKGTGVPSVRLTIDSNWVPVREAPASPTTTTTAQPTNVNPIGLKKDI